MHATIVGGGPVGALLAILLSRRGYAVDVYEARPDPRINPLPGGRSINLTLAERGWRALRSAGVEREIRALTLPLRGRMIHSDDGSLRFQPYTLHGDAIYSASRDAVTHKLIDLAEASPNVTLRFGHRCYDADVDRGTLTIRTPDGQDLEVRPTRALAADGAFSVIRRSLLRRPDFALYQRLSPISYRELKVDPVRPGEPLFSEDALHLWPRGEAMIVGFPNLDASLTVSVFMPTQGDLSFAALSDRDALEAFFEDSCGDLAASIKDLAHSFFRGTPAPLLSSGCAPWVHGGWLGLIGDAAHTLVPFLGQGLNAGLEDCQAFIECLDATDHDWPRALAAYQALRLEDGEAVIALAEQHFDELAIAARDPQFVTRKRLEEKLHELAPGRFVPLYTRVAFDCQPYSEILRIRHLQEELLDRLMAEPAIERRLDDDSLRVRLEAELERFDRPTHGVPKGAPSGFAVRGAEAASA